MAGLTGRDYNVHNFTQMYGNVNKSCVDSLLLNKNKLIGAYSLHYIYNSNVYNLCGNVVVVGNKPFLFFFVFYIASQSELHRLREDFRRGKPAHVFIVMVRWDFSHKS